MIPRPAQYLIRFDDLCPTLPRARWQEFRTVLEEFRISPILAVIPDNRDTSLDRSPSDPAFWDEMRAMEAAGATIAVHGYQHLCSSRGESLLGIHRRSEFAGVDFEIQREWIRMGLQILRDKGLNPRLWVAPRHGFDRNTLDALSNEGIEYISDGFARVPYYQDGVTWIPQQLWSPLTKSKGLWTICIHPYASRASEVDRLRSFLNAYGPQFTSFDRVLKELDPTVLGLSERIYQRLALWRVQRHHKRSRQRRRRS
jgi:predicted deacetylase